MPLLATNTIGLFAFSDPLLSDGGTNFAMVVGNGGNVAACIDGGSLVREPVPGSSILQAVWATSPDDVYVGGNSQLVHRRGPNGWFTVNQGFGFSGARAFHGAGGVTYMAGFNTNGTPAAFVSRDGGDFGPLNFPIGVTGSSGTVAALDAAEAWYGLSTGAIWRFRPAGFTYWDAGVPGSANALFATPQRLWMVFYDSAGARTEVRAFCRSAL